MGNDVYNMISRHKGNYLVSSIWIYKNKYTKQGSWFALERINYDMTYSIDQYISSIEPPVQNEEGRWYSTSRGVTTENYIWVRHGMTSWIASWWIETLPRVKWVPTFKVECRRLGYVDDLMRRTHGRCLGYSAQTRKQECGIFQMDLIKYAADRSKEILVARGFSKKEGINFEETVALGSKVHFLQNYHGSCIHDKVGLTPDGCEDNLPELCD